MVYRYKLKDSDKNKDLKSRQINGTTFYKMRWIYRPTPIDLGKFSSLVEEEVIKNRKGVETPTEKKSVASMTKEELKQIALQHSFTELELESLSKQGLIGLLRLERNIGDVHEEAVE